jgi:thermitase
MVALESNLTSNIQWQTQATSSRNPKQSFERLGNVRVLRESKTQNILRHQVSPGGPMINFQASTIESSRRRIKNLISAFAVPIMLATTLAACNTNPTISTSQSQNYQFVHTVTLQSGDTVALLEEAYSGQVIAWHPEANFAIIGSNQEVADQTVLERGRKPVRPPTTSTPTPTTPTYPASSVQTNTSVVVMAEGRVSSWASGRVSSWASGTLANGFIGNMTNWSDFFCTGWCATTTNTPYGTVSLRNLIAFTGVSGTSGIRLSGAQKFASNLGRGVKIAVIDTGVDLQHPGLKGVAGDASQPNHLAPITDWRDFVDGDASPQEVLSGTGEGYGHGTGVAGVILQVAPYATIMPIRVLGPNGSGDVTNVVSAIQWAMDHGAKIINLSLGTTARVDAVSSMIGTATSKGIYVVTASGNTNDTNVLYPAADAQDAARGGAKLISVGSTGSGNLVGAYLGGTSATAAGIDQKSEFSTFGPQVEIVAPGEIMTTLLPESKIGDWTGTSFAAPVVSGTLALALSQPLTAAQSALVGSAITATANKVDACNPSLVGQLGKGRLDAEAFMRSVLGLAANPIASCQ